MWKEWNQNAFLTVDGFYSKRRKAQWTPEASLGKAADSMGDEKDRTLHTVWDLRFSRRRV
jgi:hypothetical protein